MKSFFLRRILSALPLLLLISFINFLVIETSPGNPLLRVIRRPSDYSKEQMVALRAEYGLDDPIIIRYGKWLGRIAHGDLGFSYSTRQPVLEEIGDYLPNTLILMGTAFTVIIILSLTLGVYSASHKYSHMDTIMTSLSYLGQSIPSYWLGILLIFLFHNILANPFTGQPLLPIGGVSPWGEEASFLDRIRHLILPVAALSLERTACYARFIRASMLDILSQDYILAAHARGIRRKRILFFHALRNALPPFVTTMALDLPGIVAGALFVEVVFSWPGIGRLFYNAAKLRDYPILIAITMLIAIAVVLFNLLADLANSLLDPRVRLEVPAKGD